MLRFAKFATRPEHPDGTPNLGPGWHFDYLPNYDSSSMANLDAPEYASETLDCVRHYTVALAAGMTPLPRWALDVFHAYARRTLYGDWTHAGYLNWDTGLGSQRRDIGKVMAFAQQGLMALAISPMVQIAPRNGGARAVAVRSRPGPLRALALRTARGLSAAARAVRRRRTLRGAR